MSKTKTDCEKCGYVDELTDLEMKYDLAQRYIKILTDCLDFKVRLCSFFIEQNEQLKEKVDIYERCKK